MHSADQPSESPTPALAPALRPSLVGTLVGWSAVCFWLSLMGDGRWQYDRQGLAYGEWWRVFSAHAMHLTVAHAVGNVIGAWVLVWLFAPVFTAMRLAILWWVLSLFISAGLWWFYPDVQWYVGASGVLHGVWVAGAVWLWRRDRVFASVALLSLVIKCAVEWATGLNVGHWVLEGAPIVSAAHRLGAVVGGVVALLWPQPKSDL